MVTFHKIYILITLSNFMDTTEFEELIKKSEEDLERIRTQYFPLIEEGIITGYNLYPDKSSESESKLTLNYLHAYLKQNDRHFRKLLKVLRNEGVLNLEGIITVNNKVVDKLKVIEREASYLTSPEWKNPLSTRYFRMDGAELSTKEAMELVKKQELIKIIGEDFQYDLLIKVEDEMEMRKIIDIFKKYASKHRLGIDGRRILREDRRHIKNKNAISGSWTIPLLICTSETGLNLQDFSKVNEFNIYDQLNNTQILLSTLVASKTDKFIEILDKDNINYKTNEKMALRVFVEEYINKS